MSAPLNPDEKKEYTDIIDGLLAEADLQTVTRKKIRQGLEDALGGKDLTAQKSAIKALIEARFDAISSQAGTMPTPPSVQAGTSDASPDRSPKRSYYESNNSADYDRDDTKGEIEVNTSSEPSKKKAKRSTSLDADARLAAELQAEENRRARMTRGGGVSKVVKKKSKTPRKKSDKKVRADEDSDVDGSDESGATPKRKAGGGFSKPFNLSYPLAEVVGDTQMSRPQVVKKLWEYIKGNELQDQKDKRVILCDDKLHAVFKQTKVDMFGMNKLLGNHLYPLDEEN